METLHAFTSATPALPPSARAEMQDASVYLHRMCERIRNATFSGIEVTFAGDACQLESGRCWRLAMIVRELIESALRYGFDTRQGLITIELNAMRSVLECRIADNAGRRADNNSGPGMNLVYAQTGTLRGRLARKCDAHGTTWIVTIPR